MTKSKAVERREPTLFAIAEDAIAIEKLIFEEGGELSETLEKWLDEVNTNLAKKVDSYEFALNKFAATEVMLKDRIKRIKAATDALSNARERLKDRIKEVMKMTGQTELRGDLATFKLVAGQKIRKLDHDSLDDKYFKERQITETYLDEETLAADIAATKEGEAYPAGVSFEQVYQLRTGVAK